MGGSVDCQFYARHFLPLSDMIVFLILGLVLGCSGQRIEMRVNFICSRAPDNTLRVDIRGYDTNDTAVRFNAIDINGNDITSCRAEGQGNLTSPFVTEVTANLNTNTEVTNCGMSTRTDASNNLYYVWRFKAYAYEVSQPVTLSGFISTIECNTADLSDGAVGSIIDFNVPNMRVEALNQVDITGIDSFATGARLKLVAHFYTDGSDANTNTNLRDAKGIFLYNCFSATNEQMTRSSQQFVDENGCSINGSTFSPNSDIMKVSESVEGRVTLEGSSFPATLINTNQRTIYMTCLVGKCLTVNHPYCQNSCGASRNGVSKENTVNTGISFSDSFTVQDQQALVMYFSPAGDSTSVLDRVLVGTQTQIQVIIAPNGIGATGPMADAVGFYVTNCQYSSNAAFNNPTTFIDVNGCPVTNSVSSGFSVVSTDNNRYQLISGNIIQQAVQGYRLYARCSIGKCTVSNHNYCAGSRCGATNNNPNGAQDLGFITPTDGSKGLSTTFAVIDPPNTPALNLAVLNVQGESVSRAAPGDQLALKVTILPGGQDDNGRFADAKGVFITDCYAEVNGRREQFVDTNGCRVTNSPFATTQNCIPVHEVAGVPPFIIDCGTFTAREEGAVTSECNLATCTAEDEPACQDPCSVGNPTDQPNVRSNVATLTSNYQIVTPEVVGLTAKRSDEIRDSIIAITVVVPAVLIIGVAIVTFLVIRSQMRNKY